MSGTVANNLERSSGTIGAAGSGITVDSGDPAVDTNPSGGVGTVWSNSTSGETYVCTDATAGANVWTNTGEGTGDVKPVPAWQGENYGWAAGGGYPTSIDVIEKYSYTSSTSPASDTGDLTVVKSAATGHASTTYGYTAGGRGPSWSPVYDVIEKWQFSAEVTTGASIAVLTTDSHDGAGCSSDTHGYRHGGSVAGVGPQDVIDKFSFEAGTQHAVDHGDPAEPRYGMGGFQNATHGYAAGNATGSPKKEIDKWAFSSNITAADIGDLVAAQIEYPCCQSSETYGYCSGGSSSNHISKVSFASDGNADDIANLTIARNAAAGSSSTTYGYIVGGGGTAPDTDIIERFSFSSEGDAVDTTANLSATRDYLTGNIQY